MSGSADWDVNYYRTDYESEEHWNLRKAFMEAHKDTFPEAELVCLAQVFTNVEFLGCKYPEKTMLKVAHLSKDVAAKFRKSRENKLKRTFVGAKDAANAKAKGRGPQTKQQSTSFNQSTSFSKTSIMSLKNSFVKSEASNEEKDEEEQPVATTSNQQSDSDDGEMPRPSFSMKTTTDNKQAEISSHSPFDVSTKNLKRIPDTGFIVYETLGKQQQSICILQMSAAKQGATVKFDMEVSKKVQNALECVIRINDKPYASAPVTTNKKEAKTEAFNKALEYARKIHYTIKQKELNQTVSVDVNQSNKNDQSGGAQSMQLKADNKGFKMMKMLGWAGGALGVSGNGIEEPVSIEMKIDRSGLGLSSDSGKLNHDFFVQYLTKYKADETATYDLVFSKDFSKDERKTLHEIASRLSLKSRSHNAPDGSRILVIYKKLDLTLLANEILNDGLRAQYYELIPPTDPLPLRNPLPPAKKHKPFNQQRPPKSNNFGNNFGFNYRTAKVPKRRRF